MFGKCLIAMQLRGDVQIAAFVKQLTEKEFWFIAFDELNWFELVFELNCVRDTKKNKTKNICASRYRIRNCSQFIHN